MRVKIAGGAGEIADGIDVVDIPRRVLHIEDKAVIASPATDAVKSASAGDNIIASPAFNAVATGTAQNIITARPAFERIIPGIASEEIAPGIAGDGINPPPRRVSRHRPRFPRHEIIAAEGVRVS